MAGALLLDRLADLTQITHGAVAAHDPVFEIEPASLRARRFDDTPVAPPVLGMDPFEIARRRAHNLAALFARETVDTRELLGEKGRRTVGIVPDPVSQPGETRRLAQAVLALVHGLLGKPALVAGLHLGNYALDRGHEPREPVLHDVVLGAGPHHLDGGLLADHAGYDDERQVVGAFLDDPQCAQGIEAGKGVIADHDVPVLAFESVAQSVFIADLLVARLETAPAKLAKQELHVLR